MCIKKLLPAGFLALVLLSTPIFAGTESGGGGDASEERVNEIRSDLLSWLKSGGAKGLVLPAELSYEEYYSEMKDILGPQKVVVGFVESEVLVDSVAKTCRGYISKNDSRPHILCNIARFKNTTEADQYKLIHHEFAGLALVEKNEGAASDYSISSQITDFLTRQTVLRLAVKRKAINGNLKKLFTVEYDVDGKVEAIQIDNNILNVINTYMDETVNHTEGEPSTYPLFTSAEQTFILFTSEYTNLLPLLSDSNSERNNESLCSEVTCQVSLMTVRPEGDHITKSFYLNPIIYKTVITYFNNMLTHRSDVATFPELAPSQQTMLLLISNLIKAVSKSTASNDKLINTSKSINDSLVAYFADMVNSEDAIKRGEPSSWNAFTPAQQTKILEFLNLIETNLK